MSPMVNKRETELFLQAFEKPTQMYRYIREHHLFSPTFLHRNLSYMTGRMSRSNGKRKISQVDDVCDSLHAAKKLALDIDETPVSMRMEFLSFFDKNQPMHAITQVEFIAMNGRGGDLKKSSSQRTHVLKKITLNANIDHDTDNSVDGNGVNLSIAEMKRSMIGGNAAIKIRASAVPKWSSQSAKRGQLLNEISDHNKDTAKIYQTYLVILDETGKCVLTEGEYLLNMNARSMNEEGDYKNLRWQELPRLYADNGFSDTPTLKFRLKWMHADSHIPQDYNGNVNQRNANNIQLRDADHSDSSNGGERGMCISVSSASSSNSSRSSSSSSCSSSSSGHGTMTDKPINNNNNDDNKPCVRVHDCKARIIYRFIYNKNMSQQTETFENWNCPWCKLNCIRLDSLMIHLRLTHDHFKFEFTPASQAVIIDVSIRKRRIATRRRHQNGCVKAREEVFFFRSKSTKQMTAAATAAKMALGDSVMMECEDGYYERADAHIEERHVVSFADGHNRLYYHSQSCMPIYTVDEFEVDSEGEPDPQWLTQNCKKLVNEFTDVNEGEKEIMNLWNAHVMERNYVGDLQMVDACEKFIERYGCELIRKKLYRNFLLHLTNLHDFGLITCGTVHKIVSKLQQMHRHELSQQHMRA